MESSACGAADGRGRGRVERKGEEEREGESEKERKKIWEGSVSLTQRKARRGKGGKGEATAQRTAREGRRNTRQAGEAVEVGERERRRHGEKRWGRRRNRWRTSKRPWESRGWRFWVREEVEGERKPAGREESKVWEEREKGQRGSLSSPLLTTIEAPGPHADETLGRERASAQDELAETAPAEGKAAEQRALSPMYVRPEAPRR
ncbi:hypothetical protein OIDMADRAFT_22790 [Oidiodendron maius Zn]|uniref:Uncharacterized protein n=1 Tax=Oidiodendron maius (strain Zn) TaxID=913774 RepID=A0A0C3HYK4_OIDMZ|nr:hypothetical protein OIDMADRAFT_22790 [Oidiodendron maius Zn]